MIELNKIHHYNCYEGLLLVPDASVRCCVTSPPYYALRDYGLEKTPWPAMEYKLFGFTIQVPAMECCLGLEDTPEAFIGHLILIFREVRRVLTPDGTCWVNLGDSYWGGKGKSGQISGDKQSARLKAGKSYNKSAQQLGGAKQIRPTDQKHHEIKSKDMMGIPWMFGFAMRADRWYMRQDIIWNKTTCMPESVNDRCTKTHEYIFLFSKSKNYYFNYKAIMEPIAASTAADIRLLNEKFTLSRTERGFLGRASQGRGMLMPKGNRKSFRAGGIYTGNKAFNNHLKVENETIGNIKNEGFLRNKRSVWSIAPAQYAEAHFATFPQEIPLYCILAGSAEGDTVLDPFSGSGTTAAVAAKLGRKYLGFEQNADYIKLSDQRLHNAMGLFKQ